MATVTSTRSNSKLKKALKVESATPMESLARPGAWKTHLLPAPSEGKVRKDRQVPLAIDEAIVTDVANGGKNAEIEEKYHVREGYVRTVLIRRFGSIDGMKKALQGQCLENAIALNEYAIERLEQIPPSQALVGAKIMIDGALALEKSSSDRPIAVDFVALFALGRSLENIEKVVSGSDRTVPV